MHPRILKRLHALILSREYVVTLHAYDEMAADDLTVWDVESAILTGKIVEKQKDARTKEWKYRVRGSSIDGVPMEVVVKLGMTGKLVFITVYIL